VQSFDIRKYKSVSISCLLGCDAAKVSAGNLLRLELSYYSLMLGFICVF